jgi:hypothetical protein
VVASEAAAHEIDEILAALSRHVPWNQDFEALGLLTAAVGWPASFQPMMPSTMTLTSL